MGLPHKQEVIDPNPVSNNADSSDPCVIEQEREMPYIIQIGWLLRADV